MHTIGNTHTAAENISHPSQHSIEEVENLTNELKRLLVNHEGALDQEGLRREVETLERWMESYRRGLAAAHKISESGITWLGQLRDRLKMAADEHIRLEGEGGSPADSEQTKRTEELLAAANRIDRAIPDIEHMFARKPVEEDA